MPESFKAITLLDSFLYIRGSISSIYVEQNRVIRKTLFNWLLIKWIKIHLQNKIFRIITTEHVVITAMIGAISFLKRNPKNFLNTTSCQQKAYIFGTI